MYMILASVFMSLPLVGIIMMESGAYGPSIGQDGFRNGAALAYATYLVILIAFAVLVGRNSQRNQLRLGFAFADSEFKRVARWTIALNIGFILILMFGFRAIRVLTNEITKEEFRVSLGTFGAIAFMITKFIAPMLLAYVAALWPVTSRSAPLRALLVTNFVLVFLAGLAWGFKATSIIMIMPALILLFWRVTWRELAALGSMVAATIVGLFFWFDQDTETYVTASEFLVRRLTTIQGDVAWLIWGMYADNESLPAYAKTLLVAFGDKIFTFISDIQKTDYQTWVDYHYDLLVTVVAGVPLDQVEGGHSITGTPFAEGLIAGGGGGIVVFAIIGGVLTGWLYRVIARSLDGRAPMKAAIASTYAGVVLFPWLNTGAVVQLFHLTVALGFTVATGLLFCARRVRLRVESTRCQIPMA